jgi:thiamine kinase-like enzyme
VTAARALTTPPRPDERAPDDDLTRIARVVARVPEMSGGDLTTSRLPGGLTNRNYRVTSASGRQVVVRLSSAQSALLAIDRDSEFMNSSAAWVAGVGPEVLNYDPNLSALVIDWIDGETLTAADLDDSATLALVARTCRQLHTGPRFAGDFDMFALQRRYLDLVVARGFRLPPSYLDFMPRATAIGEAMAVRDQGTVPCHNDLLAANMMRSVEKDTVIAGSPRDCERSEQSRGVRLWFVDFEYSGNADPCFELGNIASESHLDTGRLTELVAAYYGEATVGKIARARLYGLMSNYGWTLWASIQAATSELDFDFWAWGMEKYERALELLRGPDLQHLISDVREP